MPPPFNPSKSGPGGARGLVRRTQSWFAPDADSWTPTPPFAPTTATVAQQQATRQEQPQEWRPQRWFAPDAGVEGLTPPAVAFNPAPFAAAWPEQRGQQERELRQRWTQPDTEVWTPIPNLTVAPVAAQPVQQPDISEQRSNAQRWFAPDAYVGPELPPTRLYPRLSTDVGEPRRPTFPEIDPTWDVGVKTLRWMFPTRSPTTTSVLSGELTTAVDQDAYSHAFVSPPLDGPQRIEGWVRAMFMGDEDTATDDVRAQLIVRLISGDGQTIRGTLLALDGGALSNEFPIGPTSQNRKWPVNWNNSVMTPLDAQDGDRIVVEVGFRAGASGINPDILFTQHPTQDKDEFETSTTTTENGYVQFSKPYRFRGEPDTASWTIEQPAFWLSPRWFAPDLPLEGLTPPAAPVFDPASGFDWSEQPADWRPGELPRVPELVDGPLYAAPPTAGEYQGLILEDTPDAYYRFDEPFLGAPSWRSAIDIIPLPFGAHDGRYIGTGAANVFWGEPGAILDDPDTAVRFGANGTMTVVSARAVDEGGFAEWGVEVWFKTTEVDDDYLVRHTPNPLASPITGYYLELNGGSLSFGFGDGATDGAFSMGSGWNDGNWHHVFIRKTAGDPIVGETDTIRGFVDGNSRGSASSTHDVSSSADFIVGQKVATYDEAAIYTYPLFTEQITNHYVVGRKVYQPQVALAPTYEQRSQAVRWYQPEDAWEGRTPPAVAFDPASGFDWSEQPARWSVEVRFAPDASSEGLRTPAPAFDLSEQPAVWRVQTWVAPDASVEGLAPAAPFDPSAGFPWQEQPADWRPQTWTAPDASIEGLTPPAPAFDAATFAGAWQEQLVAWLPIRWFAPEPSVDGIPPFGATVATVAQEAALWPDSSGQQDRSLQPVWHAPEASTDLLQSLAAPTFATVPEQAPLWIEQPGQERSLAVTWYNAAVEPVDGPLQSWLFTSGAPTPPATPAVLFDIDSGDPFLYLGGSFIIRA